MIVVDVGEKVLRRGVWTQKWRDSYCLSVSRLVTGDIKRASCDGKVNATPAGVWGMQYLDQLDLGGSCIVTK